MFSTESDKLPKRPVVSTLTAAISDLKRWVEESCHGPFQDGDGQTWTLGIKVTRIPDPESSNGLLWSIRLGLTAQVNGADLVATGVLSPDEDSRLLFLIGDRQVPMAMRPAIHRAADESEAKRLLATALPELKATLGRQSLIQIKRDLIGRWVDERCQFGGGPCDSHLTGIG
jgi:hypothetical protein